ncbi:MAG: hypothetical protein OXJ37_10555 [Bryobacterales bacterium]|nr:hypothetical protein [Bryobacterales bacterium]MDE0622600.1 hypothetical protein [Bryobacterales bacterium]
MTEAPPTRAEAQRFRAARATLPESAHGIADNYHGCLRLPETIACKVSSESAGYVNMAAVARVDLPLEELTSKVLGVCGKDSERVARIFLRGSLVSGDSRFRWSPFSLASGQMTELLGRFPDHDPEREFDIERCDRMLLRGMRGDFGIDREVGRQRRFLRRQNFWDPALALLAAQTPRCERYSYSDRADVFEADLAGPALDQFRDLGRLLRFSSLELQVRALPASQAKLFATRA